ncbi:MAG: mycofactocin biosynthesis glycosyltransferase MftF [Vicinamibacterales bacterium]|nr:mycofactocin biosynthesis glycosyltransferase MftF [Vicinamibacterales bacterium]
MAEADPAWASQALPEDFAVTIDPSTKQISPDTIYGGSPPRALRLSPAGQKALAEIGGGRARSPQARTLGRKLIDDGLAHPQPRRSLDPIDVTIIIPAHDRVELLEETLAALGTQAPVVLVDDGSSEPHLVADAARRHGARLVTRSTNGGPGAARSSGVSVVDTEFVAFLDSDCVPPPHWLERLAHHFADPLVAAVAPRVVAAASSTRPGRYAAACGPLDLGDRPARVMPGTSVAYVPTAALIVRRSALDAATTPRGAFDPALRVGEDVDLVWRLHNHGWRVRFDPNVEVLHAEPDTWRELLQRRYRYGTSAAPLSARHPDAIAPLVLHPWPTAVVMMLLARRRALAAASFVGYLGVLGKRLGESDVGPWETAKAAGSGVAQTWRGLGKYCTQLASPALVATLLKRCSQADSRWARRTAVASLLLGPAVAEYVKKRPALNPASFCAAYVADDIAYGTGVWAGCIEHSTLVPVKPRLHIALPRSPRTKGKINDQPVV